MQYHNFCFYFSAEHIFSTVHIMPLRSAVMSVSLAVLLFLVTCPNGGLLKQDPLNVAHYCSWLARVTDNLINLSS